MKALARWCAGHRKTVLGSWVAVVIVLGVAIGGAGVNFSDATRLPASDSSTAYGLLAAGHSNAASGKGGTIVWHAQSGSVTAGADRASIVATLQKVTAVSGVQSIVSPLSAAGHAHVSRDGQTAYATVSLSDKAAKSVKKIVDAASTPALTAQVGGSSFTSETPSETSEVVGVLVALVILLLVFGSFWAALLPIVIGVAGVIVGSVAVALLSNVLTVSSVALSMGALVGLGVGIDYALLIVNRHLKNLRAGASVRESIATALDSSGRAVLFAGGTVVVALLGMVILNVQFLTGMAVGAAVTVVFTIAAALTLLPVFLSKLGPKVLRRSERGSWVEGAQVPARPRKAGGAVRPGLAEQWSNTVARRPVLTGVVALALMIVIATPTLSLRLGSADASSDPKGTVARTFNDTMAQGFGAGYDANLVLVAKTPTGAARTAFRSLAGELGSVADVASVGAVSQVGSDAVSMLSLTPKTASQSAATSNLVSELRSDVIPQAERGSDLRVYVGGTTATSIDYSNALVSKLPLYLVIIAVLGFLLLTVALRSLLVPLLGALSNLLTIAVALGATVALFQWGWGPSAIGVGGPAPVEYIVAMLIVGVIFGLSMDYQVFLVSRMREEWDHTKDNAKAVSAGVSQTGRVIATAAAIMFCVFASFGFAGLRESSEFGVGLAIAVFLDAFLMRMTIMPAIMRACGAWNWWIPSWLDRALPHLTVEGNGSDQDLGGSDHSTHVPVQPPRVTAR